MPIFFPADPWHKRDGPKPPPGGGSPPPPPPVTPDDLGFLIGDLGTV